MVHVSDAAGLSVYHVPEEIGHPVDQRADATDELQVFGLSDPLLDEVEDEAGRDKGHGEDDADGHDCIHGGRQAAEKDAEMTVTYCHWKMYYVCCCCCSLTQ